MKLGRPKSIEEKRRDFLIGLHKDVPSPKRKKVKAVSVERMADLYLAELAGSSSPSIFLNSFLDEQRIFYTYELLTECIDLLLKHDYIKASALGFSTFKISRDKDVWTRRMAKTWTIAHYTITDEGRHFVYGGQELDRIGRENRLAERKKGTRELSLL